MYQISLKDRNHEVSRKTIGSQRTEATREVFDRIAPGWYNFRHWSIFRSELEELAQRWQRGKLLNLGCAHGPDFLPFRQTFELHGVDFSFPMLQFAQKYSRKFDFAVDLVQADISHLPYATSTFDWAISVATIHHLKGEGSQRAALEELRRVLKPGGEAFVTVWNRCQPGFWFRGKEVTVPWRARDHTWHRYYYLFTYAELEKMVKQAGLHVLRSFPEGSYHCPIKSFSRNICLLVSN